MDERETGHHGGLIRKPSIRVQHPDAACQSGAPSWRLWGPQPCAAARRGAGGEGAVFALLVRIVGPGGFARRRLGLNQWRRNRHPPEYLERSNTGNGLLTTRPHYEDAEQGGAPMTVRSKSSPIACEALTWVETDPVGRGRAFPYLHCFFPNTLGVRGQSPRGRARAGRLPPSMAMRSAGARCPGRAQLVQRSNSPPCAGARGGSSPM